MLCIKYRSSDLHRLSPSECFCLPRITFFSHGDYFISQITFLSHGMHGTHGIFFYRFAMFCLSRRLFSLTETIFSHRLLFYLTECTECTEFFLSLRDVLSPTDDTDHSDFFFSFFDYSLCS